MVVYLGKIDVCLFYTRFFRLSVMNTQAQKDVNNFYPAVVEPDFGIDLLCNLCKAFMRADDRKPQVLR